MEKHRRSISRYFNEYKWSNVHAMIKNNRRSPEICTKNARGKLVVITGATSGIGYITAIKYASKGANLLCINRNKEKSEALAQEIKSKYHVNCDYFLADLSKINEVHSVAEKLSNLKSPIDVIIHNAGVYLTKKEQTEEGIEKVFMVHHLSSFIINYKLKDKLASQSKSRIIIVSSEGHRFAVWGIRLDDLNWTKRRYSGLKSYGSAKTAQLLTMLIFDEFFNETGVTINAMHPGAVKSDAGQENGASYKWFKKKLLDKKLKSANISAEALYYLGISDDIKAISGKFFNLTTQEEPAPPAKDKDIARKLWEINLNMGKIKSNKSINIK